MDLKEINNHSLEAVHFLNKPITEMPLDFKNIVFARDGIYMVLRNQLGIIIDKITNINYTNGILNEMPASTYFISFIPRPQLSFFEEILEMFKYVANKDKLELMVNVYWNEKNRKFYTELTEQTISSGSVEYSYSKKYELNENFIRYLQIHSHHSMGASFSSTDDNDEKNSIFSIFGVVGNIKSKSKFFNVDKKFRIWSGLRFIDLEFDNVFNISNKSQSISKDVVAKLDKIIENSKKSKEVVKVFPPINDKIFESPDILDVYDYMKLGML